jgi:hypothetical protein
LRIKEEEKEGGEEEEEDDDDDDDGDDNNDNYGSIQPLKFQRKARMVTVITKSSVLLSTWDIKQFSSSQNSAKQM